MLEACTTGQLQAKFENINLKAPKKLQKVGRSSIRIIRKKNRLYLTLDKGNFIYQAMASL